MYIIFIIIYAYGVQFPFNKCMCNHSNWHIHHHYFLVLETSKIISLAISGNIQLWFLSIIHLIILWTIRSLYFYPPWHLCPLTIICA
jgi:tetrahydromethanopterin S-methyltransferase subunit C